MLKTKQVVGDFEIIRLLGRGGMGEVYEAQQRHPFRRVALKVLAPWLADNQEALERFWREAHVAGNLDHPGVVRIFTSGKTGGIAYIAMQLVRGISLAELLRKVGEPLAETVAYAPWDTSRQSPPAAADAGQESTSGTPNVDLPPLLLQEFCLDRFTTLARIGLQAARALASAHRLGYLHRDIKPSNLMIDHHDQLYLLDFGLTRALDSANGTRPGLVVGTPWYMSPEQALGQPLDARSDIYSLGVTLYQLASGGKGPYTAARDDSEAVLREICAASLVPVSKFAPTMPERLKYVIARALEVDREQRYQSAEELAADLAEFLQPGSRTPQVPVSVATKPEFPRGVRVGITLVAVLGVASVIGAFVNSLKDTQTPGLPEVSVSRSSPGTLRVTESLNYNRPMGVRYNLLREDQQPVWQKALVGEGHLQPFADHLIVQAQGDKPFLVALDHPKHKAYDLAVELKSFNDKEPERNELGIFFGWRDELADPRAQMRFCAVKLDTRPTPQEPHGRLSTGTWQFNKIIAELSPRIFKEPPGIALAAAGWHKVEVAVQGKQFSVRLDRHPAQRFDLDEAVRADSVLKTFDVDCRGMLGVWVRHGIGYFRNITLLPR